MARTLTDRPLNDLIAHASWTALDRYANGLPGTDVASLDAFADEVQAMSDEGMRTRWGINSPALIADLRTLFNGSWRG